MATDEKQDKKKLQWKLRLLSEELAGLLVEQMADITNAQDKIDDDYYADKKMYRLEFLRTQILARATCEQLLEVINELELT